MSINVGNTPLAVALAALLATPLAHAADMGEGPVPVEAAPPDAGWEFSVAPYLWAAGLRGDVGLFGFEPVDVDMSFGDILDSLRFGGMVVGEAHNGSWGVLADVIYIRTEVGETVRRTVAGVPLELSGNIETSSFTGTIMGQYRAVAGSSATIDLMAGARIWSVDNDIRLSLTAGGPPLVALSGSEGSTWVDPMLGFKGRVDLDPSWYLTGWGMVGGFGAGSDIAWDLLGGVGYQWNNGLSLVGGYRAVGVDYEENGFVYDVVQHGPVVGAVFRF